MLFNYLAIFVALCISGVAAWYSIAGLMALFAGAATGVMIMGIVLEAGKIVTAIWLHRYWDKVSFLIKTYLCVAVAVLMFITSMGIFGYLSRAHLEQGVRKEILQVSTPIEVYDVQISEKEKLLLDLDGRLKQFDVLVGRQTAKNALTAFKKEGDTRKEIADQRSQVLTEITKLKSDKQIALIKKTAEEQKLKLEIGPLKYAADLVFGEASDHELEKTVRWVIIILIVVFDPLAIFLLVGATMTVVKGLPPEVRVVYRRKPGRPLGSRNKGSRTVLDDDQGGSRRKIQVRPGNNSVQIVEPPSVDLTKFNP